MIATKLFIVINIISWTKKWVPKFHNFVVFPPRATANSFQLVRRLTLCQNNICFFSLVWFIQFYDIRHTLNEQWTNFRVQLQERLIKILSEGFHSGLYVIVWLIHAFSVVISSHLCIIVSGKAFCYRIRVENAWLCIIA